MLDNTSSTASGISAASRPAPHRGQRQNRDEVAELATKSRGIPREGHHMILWLEAKKLLLSGVVSIAGPCA